MTHMVNVHTVIRCDECGFEAENHHRETGHELSGEAGLAVWVGHKGRQYNRERIEAFLGHPIEGSALKRKHNGDTA